jgi:hypothetical protein
MLGFDMLLLMLQKHAQGLDLRLNGEFVPGTESWVSRIPQTEENSDDRGYRSSHRPKVEIRYLIPDYMPNIPSMKVYLNLVYNTGVPGDLQLMQILICTK